jgi:hypothetical protein
MKGNAKDYVSTAQQFFTACDAHEVEGMLGLCADGALGRYAPYGRESVVPSFVDKQTDPTLWETKSR